MNSITIPVGMIIDLFLKGVAVGFGPCILSCAPLILPFIAAARRTFLEGFWAVIDFSFGRMFVYIVMGALFGHFGFWIQNVILLKSFPSIVWMAIGSLLAVLGLLTAVGGGLKQTKALHGMLVSDSSISMFLLGVFAGIMPCMQVIAAMADITLVSKNPSMGAFYALVFGLGTIVSPLVVVASVLPVIPGAFKDNPMVRYYEIVAGMLVLLLGLYYVIGAL